MITVAVFTYGFMALMPNNAVTAPNYCAYLFRSGSHIIAHFAAPGLPKILIAREIIKSTAKTISDSEIDLFFKQVEASEGNLMASSVGNQIILELLKIKDNFRKGNLTSQMALIAFADIIETAPISEIIYLDLFVAGINPNDDLGRAYSSSTPSVVNFIRLAMGLGKAADKSPQDFIKDFASDRNDGATLLLDRMVNKIFVPNNILNARTAAAFLAGFEDKQNDPAIILMLERMAAKTKVPQKVPQNDTTKTQSIRTLDEIEIESPSPHKLLVEETLYLMRETIVELIDSRKLLGRLHMQDSGSFSANGLKNISAEELLKEMMKPHKIRVLVSLRKTSNIPSTKAAILASQALINLGIRNAFANNESLIREIINAPDSYQGSTVVSITLDKVRAKIEEISTNE